MYVQYIWFRDIILWTTNTQAYLFSKIKACDPVLEKHPYYIAPEAIWIKYNIIVMLQASISYISAIILVSQISSGLWKRNILICKSYIYLIHKIHPMIFQNSVKSVCNIL